MQVAEPRVAAPITSTLPTLEAMVRLARQTASVVHLVVPRERDVVETARQLARAAGVDVSVDLMAATVHLRFDGA